MLKKANVSLVVGTSSWREQFVEAITVSAGRSSMPMQTVGSPDHVVTEDLTLKRPRFTFVFVGIILK